jgi:hypothetical protein
MFKNRSVVEIMVLFFSISVAISLILTGSLVWVIVIRNPQADIDGIIRALTSITSAMLGALLGLLAGKSSTLGLNSRPDGTTDPLGNDHIA